MYESMQSPPAAHDFYPDRSLLHPKALSSKNSRPKGPTERLPGPGLVQSGRCGMPSYTALGTAGHVNIEPEVSERSFLHGARPILVLYIYIYEHS